MPWMSFGRIMVLRPRETVLEFEDHFENPGDVIVEIGFGNGESTWRMAQQEPENNFIGIEVHEPGVGQLLMALEENDIENVSISKINATFM
jgi:tRNA (guanine-N7-)-methyltransferase